MIPGNLQLYVFTCRTVLRTTYFALNCTLKYSAVMTKTNYT